MKRCLDCNIEKSRKGNYCKKCGYKHRIRPIGLTYRIFAKNTGWFKKGERPWHFGKSNVMPPPWNKGTKGIVKPNNGSFKVGSIAWNKNKKIWNGTEKEYKALHYLIRKKLGSPTVCINCGSRELLVWANKSQQYKKITDDWISLCRPCHMRKDFKYIKEKNAYSL